MEMSNKQKLNTLMTEIDNLVTVLVKVDEGSEPVDTLTAQKQKVLDLLPVTPDDESGRKNGTYPMHKLLSCKPLTKIEIPLDILAQLIESGFNVNSRDCKTQRVGSVYIWNNKDTCLNLAVRKDHFEAARWLLQHGADCDVGSQAYERHDGGEYSDQYDDYDDYGFYDIEYMFEAPIAELASKANAPLDLFDLLATPKSLNTAETNLLLPLEIAIKEGHAENALRLIKLGSTLKGWTYDHMILQYLDTYRTEYHDELFTRLIPAETIAILQCAEKVLQMYMEDEKESEDKRKETQRIKYKMLNRLLQYIIPEDQMSICFEIQQTDPCSLSSSRITRRTNRMYSPSSRITVKMNNGTCSINDSVQPAYWWSLILANLGWRFEQSPQSIIALVHNLHALKHNEFPACINLDPFTPVSAEEVQLAHRIDDLWRTYRDTRSSVISLKTLCIQPIRRSMRDFSDQSFMSLGLPDTLRQLLMYQHVAEIACKALEMYN